MPGKNISTKINKELPEAPPIENDTAEARAAGRAWARLKKKIYEVDPLSLSGCSPGLSGVGACDDYVAWARSRGIFGKVVILCQKEIPVGFVVAESGAGESLAPIRNIERFFGVSYFTCLICDGYRTTGRKLLVTDRNVTVSAPASA